MKLSLRLQHIADMIPKCATLADIGTDHGYIPIYSLIMGISEKAIASDINIGPVRAANKNIRRYGLEGKITTRVGPGLSTLKIGEADIIVIAGMGGNLIADIIEENIEIAKSAKALILQPVQYPEVLRKYLEEKEFKVVDEDILKDDNKFYQIIKAESGIGFKYDYEAEYYIGKLLVQRKNPLLMGFLSDKIRRFDIILAQLKEKPQSERYIEILNLKREFEEVKRCL